MSLDFFNGVVGERGFFPVRALTFLGPPVASAKSAASALLPPLASVARVEPQCGLNCEMTTPFPDLGASLKRGLAARCADILLCGVPTRAAIP
jgi:hypothetical protein